MLKLFKYGKPYILLILAAVGLLFAQANLELALPDYLSNIVDTGIQQGGIDNAVPIAIREVELNRTFIFMDPENETKVLEKYALVDENSTDYDTYVEIYPVLANESIYILEDLKKTVIEELEEIILSPLVVVFVLEQALANPANATEILEPLGFNETTVPPPEVFFSMLSMLPPANITFLVEALTASFTSIGETMLNQVGTVAVRLEYEFLGMNSLYESNDFDWVRDIPDLPTHFGSSEELMYVLDEYDIIYKYREGNTLKKYLISLRTSPYFPIKLLNYFF